MRPPHRILALSLGLLCALVAVVAVAGCGVAGSPSSPTSTSRSPLATRASAQPADTFVSLVPACACGRHTELDLFSRSSGRMLHRLTPISLGGYEQLATPAADDRGRLVFTFTSGERCALTGNYAECPRFAPNSCRNAVERLLPGQTKLRSLFTVSGSQAIGEAVPNPRGGTVALMMTPCVSLHGTTGLFVRDLRTGATHAIATSANRCDDFGPAAWNRAGTELAFALERARGKPHLMAGGIACPSGRDYLALARVGSQQHRSGRLRLIALMHGCIVGAVGFDRTGAVAAEGCNRGTSRNEAGSHLGKAFLVQYTQTGRVTVRLALQPGLEQAVIATEPDTGNVLVTQDQPANEPYPERDWVWEFNGHHLRLISRYRANDAAQVLAIPW